MNEKDTLSVLDGIRNFHFEFSSHSRFKSQNTLNKLINSGRLNEQGKGEYQALSEILLFSDDPHVLIVHSIQEASEQIHNILKPKRLVAYITGGLEVGRHHKLFLDDLQARGIQSFIMGIETEDYVRNKGREPLFTLDEKIGLWSYLAPQLSENLLFPIPLRPSGVESNMYYDWICLQLGIFRHSQVVFIGAIDDPVEVKKAHLRRAYSSKHVYPTPEIHTSDLLEY